MPKFTRGEGLIIYTVHLQKWPYKMYYDMDNWHVFLRSTDTPRQQLLLPS